MYFNKGRDRIWGEIFFGLLIVVSLVSLFYLPYYFTDRFFTSGMIWSGMAAPLLFLLFLFIRREKICFPAIICYGGGVMVWSVCYAVFSGTFSLQQMAFAGSLFLLVLMLANSEDGLNLRVAYGLLAAVAFAEALLGIAQYFGWYEVFSSRFPVTGTFDNPAGFAVYLAICFPFAFSFVFSGTGYGRCWGIIASVVTVVAIVLSGSRTGMVAVVITGGTDVVRRMNIRRWMGRWLLAGGCVAGVVLSGGLYFLKKDSADGRLLIWRCSVEMVHEKPWFGHGPGSFGGKYMEYQACFLAGHPEKRWEWLADNVKHPFNEFLKITIEYGIVGLVLIAGGFCWLLLLGCKKPLSQQPLFLSLAASGICALFSYPLNYPSVCILLSIVAGLAVRDETEIIAAGKVIRWGLAGVAMGLFCFTMYWKQLEVRWCHATREALSGDEKVMDKYRRLYPCLRENPLFLYNYGAELHERKYWAESCEILREASRQLNDTDVQLLLADNFIELSDYSRAEACLLQVARMCPNRFQPLYHLVKLYARQERQDKARQLARHIMDKPVKIPSYAIDQMRKEMAMYIRTGVFE